MTVSKKPTGRARIPPDASLRPRNWSDKWRSNHPGFRGITTRSGLNRESYVLGIGTQWQELPEKASDLPPLVHARRKIGIYGLVAKRFIEEPGPVGKRFSGFRRIGIQDKVDVRHAFKDV